MSRSPGSASTIPRIARSLATGAALGVYRDYPTSPGGASPFAPIWINGMVRRQAASG